MAEFVIRTIPGSPFARAAASDLALAERAARGAQGSRY